MTTAASPEEKRPVTLLPLQAAHGRYRYSSDAYAPSGDGQEQALRRTHLAHTADRVDGIAEITGQLYRTSLQIPRNNPKVAYVEIDRRNIPADVADAPPVPMAYNAYASYLREQCKFSDSLSRDTRVSLQDMFIPPRFELMDYDEQTISWRQLRDHARVVMTGEPGAGKSSCLRRLILDLLAEDSLDMPRQAVLPDTLPILIQLRNFPVRDFSPATISRLVNAERAEDLLAEFCPPLEGRRVLLAIDGLDELASPSEQELFLDRLDSFCHEVPLVRVILTSRDPAPVRRLSDFARVRLLPFDTPRAQQWTVLYISTHNPGHSRWGEFMDLIRYDSQIRDLARNPLLLGLATSLHWRYPDELNNRAGLLGKCVDVLVQDWDASRGLARWRDSDVTPRQIKRLLNRLSFQLLEQERSQFTMNDVNELMSNMTGFRETPMVLLSACRTSGLVRDSGPNEYVFVHATLADYFAASEMVGRTGSVTENIRGISAREDGRLFWRLACALASNADELLEAVHQHGSGEKSSWEDKRAAAFMLAQALTEEISASSPLVDKCADVVVAEVEKLLGEAQAIDASLVTARWPVLDDRQILWAAGAAADPGEATTANLSTSANLIALIYRARTGTASKALHTRMRDSTVPLVRQAADALHFNGWCEYDVTDENGKTVLRMVVTQPKAEDER